VGMNRRLVVFVLGLVLLVIAVFCVATVWLPDRGFIPVGLGVRALSAPPAGMPVPLPRRILPLPGVRGELPNVWLRPFGLHRSGLPGMFWLLGSFVSALILATVALFIFPRRVGVLAQVLSNGWGQRFLAFVIGVLGYLGTGLLAFLIFINVVGWPLLIVISLAVYVASAFGLVGISLALGRAVTGFLRLGERGSLFNLIVGTVVLFLASIIPYLGWVVVGLSVVLGFGAILWTRAGSTASWTLDEAQE
jgi:hypothetical protein